MSLQHPTHILFYFSTLFGNQAPPSLETPFLCAHHEKHTTQGEYDGRPNPVKELVKKFINHLRQP